MVLTREVAAKLAPTDHAMMGAFAGTVEVTALQPIIFMKYAIQEGRALPRNPMHYYRGFGLNVASFSPVTATQFGASRLTEGALRKYFARDLRQMETIGCAAVGGAFSSIFSSPSELLQIQQQRTGLSLREALRSVVNTHGALTLYRGFTPMLFRESLYTAAYLGLMPVLRTSLEGASFMEGAPSSAPLLMAGVTAGVVGATASHPADTIKTRMQAFLEVDKTPEYRSVRSTMQTIVGENGWGGLMAGIGSRCARIVIATFILNGTKDFLGPKLADMKDS